MEFLEITKLFGNIPKCDFYESEINSITKISGKLPILLVEYYEKYGNYDFNDYKWVLIGPEDFSQYIDKKYIIIARENQWTCYYGIKKKHLIKDNPPVYMKGVLVDKFWEKTNSNLKFFLEEFLVKGNHLFYTKFGKNENYFPKPRYILEKTILLEIGLQFVSIINTETIEKWKKIIKDFKKDNAYPMLRIRDNPDLKEREFSFFVKGKEIFKKDCNNAELLSIENVDNITEKLKEILLEY
jgi:hypothetical protein